MMSFKWLRQIFKHDSPQPKLQRILDRLKESRFETDVVMVKQYSTTLYFYGNGSFNSLKYFKMGTDAETGITMPSEPHYASKGSTVIDLLSVDYDHPYILLNMDRATYTFDELKDYFTSMASKLRPGQGYNFARDYYIDANWLTSDGEIIIRADTKKYKYGAELAVYLNFVPLVKLDAKFDPAKVVVADSKLIKREHRKFTDPRRWLVVKQVASIGDPWVLSATATNTAQAPVYYYTVDIDIDHHSVAGYPFYISELLKTAIDVVKDLHPNFKLGLQDENINVKFKGTSTASVFKWVERQTTYPKSKDLEPIIFYKKHGISNGYKVSYPVDQWISEVEVYELKDSEETKQS